MTRIIPLLGLVLLACACTSNNKSLSQDELAQEDADFRNLARTNDCIIVLEDFKPSIEITEEIKSTDLDSLVKIQMTAHPDFKDKDGTFWSLIGVGKVNVPISVPKNSDLAKAYLLQNFWEFCNENHQYVDSIAYPERYKSSEAQKNWE